MPDTSTAARGSISAAIAAANALLPKPSEGALRFPAEDAGRSLAEIAHADLDAALQLLAERAQYITRATGAAIALRRGERNDMQCRASAGSNAPELGALLSMEYGLSGESVRTRQLLRCDDALRDPRVNSDLCKELGISSVVVLPIVSDDAVMGVFELLSDKPRAFDERDLSALLRLGEMVETAVKQSMPAKIMPAKKEIELKAVPAVPPEVALPPVRPRVEVSPDIADEDFVIGTLVVENKVSENKVAENRAVENRFAEKQAAQPELHARPISLVPPPTLPKQEVAPRKPEASAAAPGKPLFWSAAIRASSPGPARENTDTLAVPPVLRNLHKCQACGFPVSQGRSFCVECEEKQWRGERLTQPAVKSEPVQPSPAAPKTPAPEAAAKIPVQNSSSAPAVVQNSPAIAELKSTAAAVAAAPALTQTPPVSISQPAKSAAIEEVAVPKAPETSSPTTPSSPAPVQVEPQVQANARDEEAENSTLFASAAQHESWFASNKYILGALLVVAIVIGVIASLR